MKPYIFTGKTVALKRSSMDSNKRKKTKKSVMRALKSKS